MKDADATLVVDVTLVATLDLAEDYSEAVQAAAV